VTSTGHKHFKKFHDEDEGHYTVRFTTAGTNELECTIHPASMQGKIIVK